MKLKQLQLSTGSDGQRGRREVTDVFVSIRIKFRMNIHHVLFFCLILGEDWWTNSAPPRCFGSIFICRFVRMFSDTCFKVAVFYLNLILTKYSAAIFFMLLQLIQKCSSVFCVHLSNSSVWRQRARQCKTQHFYRSWGRKWFNYMLSISLWKQEVLL